MWSRAGPLIGPASPPNQGLSCPPVPLLQKCKKSKQASLENKKGTYFIIGLIVSFSLILISFEWTSTVDIESDLAAVKVLDIDVEIIQLIRRDEPKPKRDLP